MLKQFSLTAWLPSGRTAQILVAVLLLPLLTIPQFYTLSKDLRANTLLVLALFLVIYEPARRGLGQNFAKLAKPQRIALLGIGVAMLVSTLLAHTAITQRLMGYAGDNEGLLIWLGYLILGMSLAPMLPQVITKRSVQYVLTGLLFLMLALALPDLLRGFRFGGSLYQATGMGIWCALLLFWLLAPPHKNDDNRLFIPAIVLATVGLFLSQSRIAISVSELLLAGRTLYYLRLKRYRPLIPLLCILVFLLSTPFLSNAVFARLHSRAVEQGVHYRIDLYQLGLQRVTDGHLLVGAGASSADTILNQRVPAGPIHDTLEQGFVFWYAHDLFLDTGLLFGGIAGLFLIALTAIASYNYLRSRSFILITTWTLLLANALVNTPSLELTSLFFIALIYGLEPDRASQSILVKIV